MASRSGPAAPFGAATPLAVNDLSSDADPEIGKDGTVLVFASDRAGGVGTGDLWMSTLGCQ